MNDRHEYMQVSRMYQDLYYHTSQDPKIKERTLNMQSTCENHVVTS